MIFLFLLYHLPFFLFLFFNRVFSKSFGGVSKERSILCAIHGRRRGKRENTIFYKNTFKRGGENKGVGWKRGGLGFYYYAEKDLEAVDSVSQHLLSSNREKYFLSFFYFSLLLFKFV